MQEGIEDGLGCAQGQRRLLHKTMEQNRREIWKAAQPHFQKQRPYAGRRTDEAQQALRPERVYGSESKPNIGLRQQPIENGEHFIAERSQKGARLSLPMQPGCL